MGQECVDGRRKRRGFSLAVVVSTIVGAFALMGTSSADVTAVRGSAYGYRLTASMFGGPANTRGEGQVACTNPPLNNFPPGCAYSPATSSSPSVVLPPAGGNVTQTDPDGASASVGPAFLFSAEQMSVSTQGTTGPTGSVTSSTSIGPLNTSRAEVLSASNLGSTCTASETGVGGTTTVTAGSLFTDNGNDANGDGDYGDPGEHPPVEVPLPTAPAPNTTYDGHVHVNGGSDIFRYVFNEQIVNFDGSITVNAAHQYLIGPTAVGDLIIGQVVCGVTAATTTTTTTLPVTTTTSVEKSW